jgi:hypothetical protein
VKAVGAAANLKPPEEATSRSTVKTPPEKKETEGATSGAISSKDPTGEEKSGLETEENGEGARSARARIRSTLELGPYPYIFSPDYMP